MQVKKDKKGAVKSTTVVLSKIPESVCTHRSELEIRATQAEPPGKDREKAKPIIL